MVICIAPVCTVDTVKKGVALTVERQGGEGVLALPLWLSLV